MSTVLDRIVATKRQEIAAAKARLSEKDLEKGLAEAPPVRDFCGALDQPGEVRLIAEVKKASPSAGIIRVDFDPAAIARTYADHGAACVSVLTDAPYFQGSLENLAAIRRAINAPVLRKDFIIDRYQVLEARLFGADAILLIAEVLEVKELAHLMNAAHDLGMDALVELHDAENLSRVVDSGARLIGINNRDLRTFVTRLEHTLELAGRVPPDRCLVSESGIRNRQDVRRLREAGVKAMLVGETLMRSADIGGAVDELLGRGP